MSENPFDLNAELYDNWYEENQSVWKSELKCIQKVLPNSLKYSAEIGCGTGRFCSYLNIPIGIEPSRNMGKIATTRNTKVISGLAEQLPFQTNSLNLLLLTTTFCFLNNPKIALKECGRVLKNDGSLILAIIDKNSKLGKKYEDKKEKNPFYKEAHFYSTDETLELLNTENFSDFLLEKTLNHSFVVIKSNNKN